MSKNKKENGKSNNTNNNYNIHELDFTEDQMKELRATFALFDKDGDGCITSSELQEVTKSLRQTFSKDDVKGMIQQVDVDGNGTIDFDEFLQMMSKWQTQRSRSSAVDQSRSEEDEMRQAFRVFDIDGNGLIDERELLQTMRNLGENLTEKDVKAMIKAADQNGDEKIDYEEFIRMMYNK